MSQRRKRPDWDEYFMNIAAVAAERSSCCRRQVAAVIVRDNRIISTGYNGTPRGVLNCDEGGCPRCNRKDVSSGSGLSECICSHAEENAIVQAAAHGTRVEGASLYTTLSPCLLCAKMIINAGIREVIYRDAYALDHNSNTLFEQADIKLRLYQKED